MKIFLNIVLGTLISVFAFRAAKAGNVTAAVILVILYFAVSYMI